MWAIYITIIRHNVFCIFELKDNHFPIQEFDKSCVWRLIPGILGIGRIQHVSVGRRQTVVNNFRFDDT